MSKSDDQKHLVVFQNKSIRRIMVDDEWFFSVIDVIAVLTDSTDPGAYWRKLKQRLTVEGSQVVTFCHGLKLPAQPIDISICREFETDAWPCPSGGLASASLGRRADARCLFDYREAREAGASTSAVLCFARARRGCDLPLRWGRLRSSENSLALDWLLVTASRAGQVP